MTMNSTENLAYSHLNKAAIKIVDLPDEQRIQEIKTGTWITYTRAKQVLAQMEELFVHPRIIRMPNMLIVGSSNNGKTQILRHFEEKHKPDPNPEGDYTIIPVLFVEAPGKPDIGAFYDKILEALWQPYSIRAKDSDKEREVKKVLRSVQLKVLMIDEIQHIIAGGQAKQREFRNSLKSLGNELQISIICAGVNEAFNAFNTDEQLSNRFEPEFLPKWSLNNEYGDLLESFERRLPLRKPSNLRADPAIAQKVLWMSEGILGEVHEVLKRSAILAIKNKSEQITMDVIEQIRWTQPSKRKVAPPPT
ncbi:bacterial TniB protein [mine drainage metagenome]|uniref:Bacterial TniB protein n=1 Tax=mine drainage metagenome TaxID=410659 RepID=A0A1J5QWS5_9ZZZZ